MAFEIITLQLPYTLPPNSSFFRLISEVLKGKRLTIPPTMNTNQKDLICSCWSSDGNERPTFAQIFECLSKPDYFIPGVDPNEYNANLNSLNDDSVPLCQEPSFQLIVDQANKGNVEMMKQAADDFFEGVDKFPFDKDQALKYYRMHAFATSPAKINEMGSSTSQTVVDEFQNETSSQEDQRDQKQKQSLSPSTFIYRSDSDTQSNPLIDTDSLNSISPSTFTYPPDTVDQYFTYQERLSFLPPPPDIRSKIKGKESSEELFEIGDNFQNGSNFFPQIYQLSSYFFRKAFLALRNETKNEFNDKEEEFHIEPISIPRYSSMGGRPQSGFIQPQHISVIPIDFRPIYFQALKANIPHVNILINGNVTSISPVVKTMKSNQNAPEFDVDSNFMRFDIDGKGITIFQA